MKPIPHSDNGNDDTVLLRTFFDDDAAWDELCAAVRAPVGEFRAYVMPVSDPSYAGITVDQVVSLAGPDRTFLFVADRVAHEDPEHTVLVVDVAHEPGRTFRVIPSEAWGVENNLSIANMDFEEFADAVDQHGVFRGFPAG